MDSYTDTYQGNDDFYNNLLSQGVDLVAGAGYIAYNVLTAATLATTASFAGVALFKGPKKAVSYFDRYITFPMERKSRKIRSCWARRTGTNCISKVVDAIFPCYNKANKATFDRFINHFDNAYNSYTEVRDQCELLNSRISRDFQGVPVGFNANETRNVNINAIVNEFQRLKDEVIAAHRGVITSITDMNNIIVETINFCENHGFKNSQGYYKMQYNLQDNSHRLRSVQASINYYSEMDIPQLAIQTYERLSNELLRNEGRRENVANSVIIIDVNREILNSDPKSYLKEFLRKSMEADNFRFSIVGEDAVDAGGVTREVYTTLFRSLLEEDADSFRSILDLGEDIDVYKGLGVALSKVANNESLFLKDYFDRDLFRVIDKLTVDELALLTRGEDMKAIEPIKQRLILDIPRPGLAVRSVLEAIFDFNTKEEKTASDFAQMQEWVESVLDYEGEDLNDLKEKNLEEYQKTIQDSVDKWLQDNQKYVLEADRLIHITTYYKEVGQALSKGLDLQAPRLKEQASAGVSALEKIVAPLDREMLASAIEPAIDGLSDLTAKACIRKKMELIQDWVRTKATDPQLYDFIQFCTGCAVLGAGQTIKISYSSQKSFEAHTCFNRLDLYTTFEQRQAPENTTDEQVYDAFIRDFEYMIIPNSGADFTDE